MGAQVVRLDLALLGRLGEDLEGVRGVAVEVGGEDRLHLQDRVVDGLLGELGLHVDLLDAGHEAVDVGEADLLLRRGAARQDGEGESGHAGGAGAGRGLEEHGGIRKGLGPGTHEPRGVLGTDECGRMYA